jgi:hypothetical protein
MKPRRIIQYGRTRAADRAMRATLVEHRQFIVINHTPDDPNLDPFEYLEVEMRKSLHPYRVMPDPPPSPPVKIGPTSLPIREK